MSIRKKPHILFLFCCGLAVSLTGCFSLYQQGDVLRDERHFAAPYTVIEEVQYEYNDFFDDHYQRVYVVQAEGEELVEFRGDTTMWSVDTDLSLSSPKVVEDWLAVFSTNQVWIWQPEKAVVAFDPIERMDATDWESRQMVPPDLPDYWASDFKVADDGKWILEYTDVFSAREGNPQADRYYLVSEDEGKTFFPIEKDLVM